MKRMVCLLLAAVLVLLPGCAGAGGDGVRLTVWFAADPSGPVAPPAALAGSSYQGEGTVPALMQALLDGPEPGSGLVPAIPQGVRLLDWSMAEGVARVDLSQPYGDLVGMELTLADYSITLTLTQLEEVQGVIITVNGSQPPEREGEILRADDVVFSGIEEDLVELSAALYFRRADTGALGYELRVLQVTQDEEPVQAALEALLAGPQDEGLAALLPAGMELRGVRVDNRVCYVDLSQALLTGMPTTAQEQALVIDSIVSTLCSLDTVDGVQLLVEGESLTQYGQLMLEGTLAPRGD